MDPVQTVRVNSEPQTCDIARLVNRLNCNYEEEPENFEKNPSILTNPFGEKINDRKRDYNYNSDNEENEEENEDEKEDIIKEDDEEEEDDEEDAITIESDGDGDISE